MSDNLKGSCLCGTIKYQLTERPRSVANCHCNTCKKLTSGAFQTVALVREQGFELIEGQDNLSTFEISGRARKHFCRTCGTPIYNLNKNFPGWVLVPIGPFDNPAALSPTLNVYCESMLEWVRQIGELKSFDQGAS
ncbi:MAG: aldehyde-activating protein [Desulfuromonas sp.]|nr:MAG: aldehyde-activating protein [Desulfuromonas sp.]